MSASKTFSCKAFAPARALPLIRPYFDLISILGSLSFTSSTEISKSTSLVNGPVTVIPCSLTVKTYFACVSKSSSFASLTLPSSSTSKTVCSGYNMNIMPPGMYLGTSAIVLPTRVFSRTLTASAD